MKVESFFSDTLYHYAKNKLMQGFYGWLFKQELDELKNILREEKEIVPQINRQYADEDIQKIPRYLREIIVDYLPQIKDKLIRDTIQDLANDDKYHVLVKVNKPYLYELLERSLNMLYLRTRESLD